MGVAGDTGDAVDVNDVGDIADTGDRLSGLSVKQVSSFGNNVADFLMPIFKDSVFGLIESFRILIAELRKDSRFFCC